MKGPELRCGSSNGASKLSPSQVLDLRRRYAPGTGNNKWKKVGNVSDLAAEFGINKRTVLAIVSGEIWGWLDDEDIAA